LIIFTCICFCFQKAQTSKFGFNLGLGTGISTGAWVGRSENQAAASIFYKRISLEMDYCIQPFSHFGIKKKLIMLLGYNSDVNKKLVFNIMLGDANFHGQSTPLSIRETILIEYIIQKKAL